jgi:hypothetical protein
VVRPISVDKTLSKAGPSAEGRPPELLQHDLYNRLINSPFSVVGQTIAGVPRHPAGLHASGNEWVSLHRNYDPAETAGGEITTVGTSELPMRNQYRTWARYMTETM